LLEIVAERYGTGKSYKAEIDLNGAVTDLEWLAGEMNIKPEDATDTLKLFANVALIDAGAWAKSVIAIPQLQEYSDEYSARAKRSLASSKEKNSKEEIEVEVEKEKEVVVEVEGEVEEKRHSPDSVGTSSRRESKCAKTQGQENHYMPLTGAWERIGLHRISGRYSDFRNLVKGMKRPAIKETKAAFCGRILDECGKQGVEYPKEFLAITRRLRKDLPNSPFFSVAEQIAEENRRLGTL
jgi:hypothetical protein